MKKTLTLTKKHNCNDIYIIINKRNEREKQGEFTPEKTKDRESP